MATYPFTYSDLKASINTGIHNKMGLVATPRIAINDVVNEVSGLYLRSAKRKAVLAPNLFNDIYQYGATSDIDGNKLIGIQPQSMDRDRNNIWSLVTEEEFDIRKQTDDNLVAFSDHTFVRGLLISQRLANLRELTIAQLVSISEGNGTWIAFGDGTNLQTDTYNFIKGSGSVEFDINSGGTTAGIQCTNVPTFNLTQYTSNASVFTWVYITTAATPTAIVLRVGSSSSNYYQISVTTPNDGGTFVNGWNLIRFDFNTKTTTGSPTAASGSFVALYFTKSAGAASDTAYRFNWLNAKQGNISNLIYYSSKPWQSLAGTLLNVSTADTDYLVCDQDEYSLFLNKGIEVLGAYAREYQDSKLAADKYMMMSKEYKRNYPTEALQLTSSYYYMGNKGTNNNINQTIRLN